MILCSDSSLYTGITTDVERRFRQHLLCKGAKYFRHCRPLRLVYVEQGHNRGTASRREAAIKKMKRIEKLELIAQSTNQPLVSTI